MDIRNPRWFYVALLLLIAIASVAFGLFDRTSSLAAPALAVGGILLVVALFLIIRTHRTRRPTGIRKVQAVPGKVAATAGQNSRRGGRQLVLLMVWVVLCVIAVVIGAVAYVNPSHPLSTPGLILSVFLILPFLVNRFRFRRRLHQESEKDDHST